MPYSQEEGYVPVDIPTLMDSIMGYINTQFGTTYTTESFIGTNFYKWAYALAQRMSENEVKTSEIFVKLQAYIDYINARISRPVNTNPGLVEKMQAEGYIASLKPPSDVDAGKIYICVDVDDAADDYADTKLAICTLISQITIAGCPTQGSESETIVLSNGQSFDFKYALPDRAEIDLRLTLTLSENNQVVIGDPDDVKAALLENIQASYKLGKNFEPQRYFGVADAPWASTVLLEWSDDGGSNWHDEVFDAAYDDLFDIALDRIELVEA